MYLWVLMTAVAELFGALLSYMILVASDGSISDEVYGVMYAMTSGIMAFLSLAELIPKAVRYDPNDEYTSKFVFLGIFIMMASVVLFSF